MSETSLATHALSLSIGDRRLCDSLNITIRPGECWCILGRNGSGKTTLLHTLAGLRQPNHGSVTLNGQAVTTIARRKIAQQLGLLPQDHVDTFPATVMQTTLMGRHPHLDAWAWEGADDEAIARRALQQVGLENLAERDTATLSGGERRRLGMATLFTQDPAFLLLDEPTNHLDLHHQVEILTTLNDHAGKNKKAVVMVLHDLNLASRFCDRALLMFENGNHLAGDTKTLLTRENLTQLYEHPMIPAQQASHPTWLPE